MAKRKIATSKTMPKHPQGAEMGMSDRVASGQNKLLVVPAAVIGPEPESAWKFRLWPIIYISAASVIGAVLSGLPVKIANSASIQGSRWAKLCTYALVELGSATLLVAVMAVVSWFATTAILGRSKLLITVRVVPVTVHPAPNNNAK